MIAPGVLPWQFPWLLALLLLVDPIQAEPRAPEGSPRLATLEFGAFCAEADMRKAPAPGTLSGWLNVPDGEIAFHWPDRRVVPAAVGLAFGVRARLESGAAPFAEIRVYRPGRDMPETWGSGFGSLGETVSFFSFDRQEELIPGLWRLEAWDAGERLYSVEFEIVPAATLPEMTSACGAIS